MRYIPKTILSSACLTAIGASTPSVPPHLQQAELIAHQIDQSHNEYAHKDCFIKWKGEDGATRFENRTDCSDFLDLLLEHTYHVTQSQMQSWTGRGRPLAETWFDAISQGHHFDVIQKISDVAPGDVIAIKFPPGAGDTGHIMLAASRAEKHPASAPLENGTVQWELPVVDSSKSGHGPTDTRREANGTFHTGVGAGVFRIYANADGQIVGYAWSTVGASKFESASERKVVVGRLQIPGQ